ncbi:MAG: hypothetical protein CL678_07820 [Bdellovibrionaceae bacterium]|nr:hypothetical protein [Pseudobdellovibrionaceae bacterium]|tara:strand:+ start:2487 stop:3509 length:1023 start_codon:yes stop_codon:yes gene_type:complete
MNALIFVGLGLAWGSSFYWIKIALGEVNPATLVALRISFAALTMLVLAVPLKIRLKFPLREWKYSAALSLLNPVLPFYLISWAETVIPSSIASLINGMVAIATMILAFFFLEDEKINRFGVFGILLGFSGVAVLMSPGLNQGIGNALGFVAMIVAVFSYAGSTVFIKKKMSHLPPRSLTAMMMITGALWVGIIPFLIGEKLMLPQLGRTWFALGWMGILGTALAFLVYFKLLKEWGATKASLVNYLLPMTGMFLGVVFLKEPMNIELGIGSALILFGVYLVKTRGMVLVKATVLPPPFIRKVVPPVFRHDVCISEISHYQLPSFAKKHKLNDASKNSQAG